MAEGDSVFRMARRIEPAASGRTIESVEVPSPRSPLRRSAERLTGDRIESVETRGKHMILNFANGLSVHSHMGMVGGWQVYRVGERWRRPRRSAWLVLGMAGTSPGPATIEVAQFGGPTLRLVRTIELGRDPRLARLGPDLLDPGFDPEACADRLRVAGPTPVGEALLDQALVAGIGNIFKSESCFEAGIDPWQPVESLEPERMVELLRIACEQLRAGAETGRRPGRIYRKANRPCSRCGTRIRSWGQGDDNRTTYWCPVCQT